MLFNVQLVFVTFAILTIQFCEGFNKYSAEANEPTDENPVQEPISLRDLDKPFRMAKLNMLWIKAKHRLPDPKLQSIFSELKIHDKEEIVYKHFKAEGKDKSGLEEAKLRKKLIGIMSTYGLLEHFAETDDPKLLERHKALNDGSNYVAKNVFQDQRLNKLWAKAEMAGFSHEELEALKEEFTHHQDKVDEYMSLLKDVNSGDPDIDENSVHQKPESWNMLDEEEEPNKKIGKKMDHLAKTSLLRDKHMELRSSFDTLDRLTAQGPKHKEFVEPKVQGLWRMAVEAKFSSNELASLKEELFHYETRLLKLRHLGTEKALEAARQNVAKNEDNATIEQNIKKLSRTVAKLHTELEFRITQRHSEL